MVSYSQRVGDVQITAVKASMSGGVLQYASPGQLLDGGNFSAFIMAAMLDPQVLPRTAMLEYKVVPASVMAAHDVQYATYAIAKHLLSLLQDLCHLQMHNGNDRTNRNNKDVP